MSENDPRAKGVVHGEAVLEAMGTTRILRDVPADGTDALRRGVRRVVVTLGPNPFADVEIDHARLHTHPAVLEIDLQNAAHPRHSDENAAWHRKRSAGQAGSCAAGDNRKTRLARDPDDLGDFLGGSGE